MLHLVARACPGTLLFRTHTEARHLFGLLAAAFPHAEAFCLMPDHVHVLPAVADRRLAGVMSAYARWRNARREEHGAVWDAAPAAAALPDAQHERRTVRYVLLNPCRAGLVDDPLAWPWSTHRDALGLAAPAVRARVHDPARFHRWVSADPTVCVSGTGLPEGTWGTVKWEDVREAVAGVCRVTLDELRQRGPARTLALRAARLLDAWDPARLRLELGVSESTLYRSIERLPARSAVAREPDLHACVRAVGDARFGALPRGDVRRLPGWERYRGRG